MSRLSSSRHLPSPACNLQSPHLHTTVAFVASQSSILQHSINSPHQDPVLVVRHPLSRGRVQCRVMWITTSLSPQCSPVLLNFHFQHIVFEEEDMGCTTLQRRRQWINNPFSLIDPSLERTCHDVCHLVLLTVMADHRGTIAYSSSLRSALSLLEERIGGVKIIGPCERSEVMGGTMP